MKQDCARAEILAGAIALGEASDAERDDYRRHIAACSSCLGDLGGEREIERVMATVAQARDAEVWEPAPVRADVRRQRKVRFAFAGASAIALGVVVSLGVHAFVAANLKPLQLAQTQAPVATGPVYRVTFDKPASAALPAPKHKAPARRIVVVHNVITLERNQKTKIPVRSTTTVVAEAPAPAAPERVMTQASNVPVWRRNQPIVSNARQPVAVAQAAPPVLAGRAESIAVAPSYVVRGAMPIGGENAINPQPPPIAYAQGAEGTTAFEVAIDERGAAVKCTITKSSGYLSLDDAVCKAAMKARYSPRTINGRAVAGIYRDAFTFRASSNSDSQL